MEYDVVFSKDGNGIVEKTRFPDGESLNTIKSNVRNKKILIKVEEHLLDWMFVLGYCINEGAHCTVDIRNSMYKDINKIVVLGFGAEVID